MHVDAVLPLNDWYNIIPVGHTLDYNSEYFKLHEPALPFKSGTALQQS